MVKSYELIEGELYILQFSDNAYEIEEIEGMCKYIGSYSVDESYLDECQLNTNEQITYYRFINLETSNTIDVFENIAYDTYHVIFGLGTSLKLYKGDELNLSTIKNLYKSVNVGINICKPFYGKRVMKK